MFNRKFLFYIGKSFYFSQLGFTLHHSSQFILLTSGTTIDISSYFMLHSLHFGDNIIHSMKREEWIESCEIWVMKWEVCSVMVELWSLKCELWIIWSVNDTSMAFMQSIFFNTYMYIFHSVFVFDGLRTSCYFHPLYFSILKLPYIYCTYIRKSC